MQLSRELDKRLRAGAAELAEELAGDPEKTLPPSDLPLPSAFGVPTEIKFSGVQLDQVAFLRR